MQQALAASVATDMGRQALDHSSRHTERIFDNPATPSQDSPSDLPRLPQRSSANARRNDAAGDKHGNRGLLAEAAALADLATWDLQLDGCYWSPALCQLLGYPPEVEMHIGHDAYLEHVIVEDRPRFEKRVQSCMESDGVVEDEHRIRRVDQFVRWVRVRARVVRDEHGVMQRCYGFVQDITEHKLAAQREALEEAREARLREANCQTEEARKDLSTFSAVLSHDLRAPLHAIAEDLAKLPHDEGDRLTEGSMARLDAVQSTARRIETMLGEILSLAELRTCVLDRVPVDLTTLAREVAEEIQQTQPERQVEWRIADGLAVHADRALMRSMLASLLGNAFQVTQACSAPVISIETVVTDGDTAFCVRDNGTGCDARQARRLFEPFYRKPGSVQFEGNATGLAKVWRIVRRHGGWVIAESEPEGGSAFYFTVPAES